MWREGSPWLGVRLLLGGGEEGRWAEAPKPAGSVMERTAMWTSFQGHCPA